MGNESSNHGVEPIGDRVRNWRKGRDWSQAMLATELGVDAQTVSNLETGKTTRLQPKYMVKLRQLMGEAFDSSGPLTLRLRPEVMQAIEDEAQRENVTIEEMAERLLMEGAQLRNPSRPSPPGVLPFTADGTRPSKPATGQPFKRAAKEKPGQ